MIDAEIRRVVGPLRQADFLAGARALENEPNAIDEGRAAAMRLRIFHEDFANGRVEIKSLEQPE